MAQQKPTLGFKPNKLFIANRIYEMEKAIQRRLDNVQEVPERWIKDYNELVAFYDKRYR